jgi:ketosteroid isomerase-like protein
VRRQVRVRVTVPSETAFGGNVENNEGELMLNWLAKRMVQRTFHARNAGDVEAVMAMMTDDIRLVFPGTSSWAGEYRGKLAVEGFVRRVVEHGLQYRVHDALIKGPPWNMTLVYLISDEARDAAGNIIYANRAVEYCKLRWFKMYESEIFEDTERSSAFDRVPHLMAART